MDQLIDELLAFSRISRQTMEWSEVELGPLAQAVFDDVPRKRRAAGSSSSCTRCRRCAAIPPCSARC